MKILRNKTYDDLIDRIEKAEDAKKAAEDELYCYKDCAITNEYANDMLMNDVYYDLKELYDSIKTNTSKAIMKKKIKDIMKKIGGK